LKSQVRVLRFFVLQRNLGMSLSFSTLALTREGYPSAFVNDLSHAVLLNTPLAQWAAPTFCPPSVAHSARFLALPELDLEGLVVCYLYVCIFTEAERKAFPRATASTLERYLKPYSSLFDLAAKLSYDGLVSRFSC
jgi:hypothetical protein